MALLQMPLDQNDPWYTFTCTLERVSYTFELAINTRADRWMMTIGDALGTPVVSSIPLLIQRDLLGPFRTYAVPPGIFFVLDNSGQMREPTAGSFLLDHVLYYQESTT